MIKDIQKNNGYVDVKVDNPNNGLHEFATNLAAKEVSYYSVGIFKPTLEDVFLQYTGKSIRES